MSEASEGVTISYFCGGQEIIGYGVMEREGGLNFIELRLWLVILYFLVLLRSVFIGRLGIISVQIGFQLGSFGLRLLEE